MLSRLKIFSRIFKAENQINRLKESTDAKQTYSQLFFNDKVQKLLQKLILVDMNKLFEVRNMGKPYTDLRYELLTTEELNKAFENANKVKDNFLQIPPVIDPVEDKVEILDENLCLDGFDAHHSKHLVIDTSISSINENRTIVVREPNGVLRTANREERKRVNQIYFPLEGREIITPRMFEDENFAKVLEREEYKFILDRACIQFDPDEPAYHKIIQLTYEQINHKMHFEAIHHTRHFGSLAFYLVTHKKIDNLVQFIMQCDRLEEAYTLIQLYHIIHPNCKSAEASSKDKKSDILKNFIDLDAAESSVLMTTLNNCLKKREEKEKLEEGIKKAHGLQ